jgi:prepilin-type N-terminal cleavage/methylation domain-containing protein
MNRSPHKSAFTLIEMLFVVALLSVAMLLQVRVFRATMRVITDTPAVTNMQAGIENMTASLRRDVWSATKIDTPDPSTVILTLSNGTTARWQLGAESVVRQVDEPNPVTPQRWLLPFALQAQRQGGALLLRSTSIHEDERSECRFASQVLAFEEARS